MKKLVLGLTLAAFAALPVFAGEGKECQDAKAAKACADAKVAKAASCESACATACAKQARLKKGFNPSENKGATLLAKR